MNFGNPTQRRIDYKNEVGGICCGLEQVELRNMANIGDVGSSLQ